MDFFVCGEALWISCGTWIAFWGGVIGALFAAVLSAGVAYLVVGMTNAQARHGIERTVEVAAIGDCVAAMEGLEWAMRRYDRSKPYDTGSYMLPMRAAVARLQMSRKEAIPLADILIHWPGNLSQLAEDYLKASRRGAPYKDDILDTVAEVITFANTALPWCTSTEEVRKVQSINLVKQADDDLKAALSKYEALMPR